MQMQGRNANPGDYRYGFNGKEKNRETYGSEGTSYDFGARIYDVRIARFASIDPWTGKYSWQTTYAYHRNSPISMIDWMGLGDPTHPPLLYDDERPANVGMGPHLYGGGDLLSEVIVPAIAPSAGVALTIQRVEESRENGFWASVGNFLFGWLRKGDAAVDNMKGNYKWKIGIEFSTTDGESNGMEPQYAEKDAYILEIDNYDELMAYLDLWGMASRYNDAPNPYQTLKINKPPKADIDQLFPNATGRQKNAYSSQMGQWRKNVNDQAIPSNPKPGKRFFGNYGQNLPGVPDADTTIWFGKDWKELNIFQTLPITVPSNQRSIDSIIQDEKNRGYEPIYN